MSFGDGASNRRHFYKTKIASQDRMASKRMVLQEGISNMSHRGKKKHPKKLTLGDWTELTLFEN